METLSEYIRGKISLKLSKEDKAKLLFLDREYRDLYEEFWYKWDRTDCKNLKDEFEKFINARKKREKYFPQLELVRDELDIKWLENALKLKSKFQNFNCFLSRYYIENIDYMFHQVNMTVHKDDEYILVKYNQVMAKLSNL